jgi:hypothetical protein
MSDSKTKLTALLGVMLFLPVLAQARPGCERNELGGGSGSYSPYGADELVLIVECT